MSKELDTKVKKTSGKKTSGKRSKKRRKAKMIKPTLCGTLSNVKQKKPPSPIQSIKLNGLL